ncbi:hypothetical protein [Clostridium bowmanii]|uniref:hypothetical protein n=1 Tax=Clostridium bowmanii TaxID=132925 RepID=UPI001C0A97A7|nr:hypothetical protein [Clostridium bowmanii]MBU3192260.1 hypothetical protein [Clostridium bowmanii]
MHKDLLYRYEKQNFKDAIETFKAIECLFIEDFATHSRDFSHELVALSITA